MPTSASHSAKSPVRLLVRLAGSRPAAARFAALSLVLAFLPGCQSIQTTATESAGVRFVDASPDAPGLDIYQNNTALAYNLGFGTITSYVPLASGTYTFSAEQAGSRQVLISAKQSLSAPHQYTAIVGNIAASLQETILTDQTVPAPTGEVSFRFLDQATRVGAVDIYLVPSSGKLATTSPIATDITLNGNSGYINVPAGTYAIVVVPTGTVPVSTTTTLYTGSSNAYSAGAVRTVVLIDSTIVTNPAVQAIVADDYDSPSATS